MIHDLAIIGNGIFGKLFLHEISKHVNKSQNFSIAHIFEENLAPACSLRSTATVSYNGIEEGVSHLGNELVLGVVHFEKFFKENSPKGVWPIRQIVCVQGDLLEAKFKRRYKEKISILKNKYLKTEMKGVELNSYIVLPDVFLEYLATFSYENMIYNEYKSLVTSIVKNDDYYDLKLFSGECISARKVILGTGAYTKIFSGLLSNTLFIEEIEKTKVVAGSYLIKQFDYHENFYLTINGHSLIYRLDKKELIIGSATTEGAIVLADLSSLKKIFDEVQKFTTLDLGEFSSFKAITGLRHKGHRRIPSFQAITEDKNIWLFNGGYKNGWSMPFYYIARDLELFIK